uniref:WH1 domain-containing protein n=1 Tax=Mesocestoides corti TaxID=53468 RepID=A0A5K3FBI1_MESCO
MDTDIYVLQAFYCGFCSIRHQPFEENDIPDYLARRVQLKPRVACTIHGDICGFVVTTAKARAFPAAVITGYFSLNNAAHTVAVRHCETDHFLAGYRFFSFDSTEQQDYFVQYLDSLLDSLVSMVKRNSTSHYDYPMGRWKGEGIKRHNNYGIPSLAPHYGGHLPPPTLSRPQRGQLRGHL